MAMPRHTQGLDFRAQVPSIAPRNSSAFHARSQVYLRPSLLFSKGAGGWRSRPWLTLYKEAFTRPQMAYQVVEKTAALGALETELEERQSR